MLEQTFCHIQGIGHAGERRLWRQGLGCWRDLLARPGCVPRVSAREIVSVLDRSLAALADDPAFFATLLNPGDRWRLFPHFRARAGYLDIETTGLGLDCEITTIALYDGDRVRTYVNGVNLDAFLEDVEAIGLFVTFNGRSFDIPVIERFFRVRLDRPHIDLRHVLGRLGFKGGLKRCEKQLGINRGCLDNIDGSFAVLLWREYQRTGSKAALETLLAYNVEDTVNLERLMVEAYNRNVRQTPFGPDLELDFPEPPQLVLQPDLDLIDAIRFRHQTSRSPS